MPRLLASLAAALLLTPAGCCYAPLVTAPLGSGQPPASAYAAVDAQMVQQVQAQRARAQASPGAGPEAMAWSGALRGAWQVGSVGRGALDGAAELAACTAALDAAAAGPQRPEVLAEKGRLLLVAGQGDAGVAALEASMQARPTVGAAYDLVAAYDARGRRAEVPAACKAARPDARSDDDLTLLLDACARHGGDLSWASAEDRRFYARQQQASADRAQAREAERQAQDARMRAEFDASRARDQARHPQQASAEPASSGPRSVRVHNDCPRTVKLFLGEKPKYGSGTYTTLGSNNTTSLTASTLWLVDDSENGLSSVSVGPSTSEVTVTSSCSGLTAR